MTCSAIAVANHFIQEHPGEITHLKLQKLVYISHGWHLGIFRKEELVEDELAEAWKHGSMGQFFHLFIIHSSNLDQNLLIVWQQSQMRKVDKLFLLPLLFAVRKK